MGVASRSWLPECGAQQEDWSAEETGVACWEKHFHPEDWARLQKEKANWR